MKPLPVLITLVSLLTGAAVAQAGPTDTAPQVAAPKAAFPIMTLDQVQVGMKGYGLTVFHGDKIEPFHVEVVSVMRDFAPKHGVIWIICTDERLKVSGPVAGMSGSPIYLWTDQDKQKKLGRGGKLIGAFAYGYSWIKGCYAGVQPIEAMRDTGSRALNQADQQKQRKQARGGANQSLRRLMAWAKQQGMTEDETWRAGAMAQLFNQGKKIDDAPDRPAIPRPRGMGGEPYNMMLPLAVSTPGLARMSAPLLEPMGLTPIQSPAGTASGFPPPDVDPEKTKLAPGSVLAIPLAFGDMDLSATGTVTDVLPDGRVLGFGHAMFGEGPAELPLATGFVHYVVPRLSTSFKLGGSSVIQGAVVRDEASAVVGKPGATFTTAPVKVTVRMPKQPKRTYEYNVVHHRQLTPMIAAMTVMQSIAAEQNLPVENTLTMKGKLTFDGGRTVKIDDVAANAGPQNIMLKLAPPMMSMMQNPHDSVMIKSLELDLHVEPKPRLATMTKAQIDHTLLEPGESLGVNLRFQPYQGEEFHKRIEVKLPDSLPDGRYQVTVCDARNYTALMARNRPHLMLTSSADDVFDYVNRIVSVRSDAIYVLVQLPQAQVAIGRQELPSLPSSKRALIAAPTSTLATPYFETIEKIVPMDYATRGQFSFAINVQKSSSN